MKLLVFLIIIEILFINLILNKYPLFKSTLIPLNTDIYEDKTDGLFFHIINLQDKRGEQRRNHVKKYFNEASMDYILYPAQDKDKIDRRDKTIYKKFVHKDLSNGEIAVSMTHNALYKKLLSSNEKFMLIAEDDCTIKPSFKHYLNIVLNNLPYDFDIIKLEYIKNYTNGHNNKENLDVPSDYNTRLYYSNDSYAGAAAYIVSRKGAEYILNLNEPIWLPADAVFDAKWHEFKNMERNLNVYYVSPQLAWQGDVERTII
jgi:GR25 family glycosyltransferase involved in LPS biosynthesis